MHNLLNIKESIWKLIEQEEKNIEKELKEVDKICEYNSFKVLKAFQDNKVSEVHFNETTGYGYNDIGRDTIESIYKDIFKAEDALVRGQFISGSHALTVALFALLRPNDTMLSITGKPYDTLDQVIGLEENKQAARRGGGVAKKTKEFYEEATRLTAITKENSLNYEYIDEINKIEKR